MAAAHGGHTEAVRALLAHRSASPPRLDAWDENGETALIIAARGNQSAIVRALLTAKPKRADPNRVSGKMRSNLKHHSYSPE
jgi:ankyrin repeat protein